MKPCSTFTQGFRRIWIVRATSDSSENIIVDDLGVAVVKDAVQKRFSIHAERYQTPRVKSIAQFIKSSGTETLKSWLELSQAILQQHKIICNVMLEMGLFAQLLFPARQFLGLQQRQDTWQAHGRGVLRNLRFPRQHFLQICQISCQLLSKRH